MEKNEQIKCRGIWGWIFGHKYTHIYDVVDKGPVINPKQMAGCYLSVVETVTDVINSCHAKEETYRHSICERCGHTVNAQEPKEENNVDDSGSSTSGIRCSGCGNEIDSDVCHCGDLIKAHVAGCGHSPVPMGCNCGRDKTSNAKKPLSSVNGSK